LSKVRRLGSWPWYFDHAGEPFFDGDRVAADRRLKTGQQKPD